MKKSLLIVICSLLLICLGGWGGYKLTNQNSEVEVKTETFDKVFSDNNSSNVLNPVIASSEEPEEIIEEETTEEIEEVISEIVTKEEFKKTKEPELLYTEEELNMLSHLIYGESGCCSDEMQLGVGSVVLNRVKSKYYPNTIKEVIFQEGQYACTWDGNYDKEPDERAISNAKYLLENGSQYPEYVIFQAEFKQGDGVYEKIGNTYFCYYDKD